jgi:hypothetical protein
MCRKGSLAVGLALFLFACGGKNPETPPQPAPALEPAPKPADPVRNDELERLKKQLVEMHTSLASSKEERQGLKKSLSERAEELIELDEANASLELELASALEELLRSQSSLRNVQSRAFAVSRIAEVRVELKAVRRNNDPVLRSRIERADEFLARADQTLAEDNVGGAAYLADRAGELLRQARIVAEIRKKESREILPIVPPRAMEVQTGANLRSEPSSESRRVGGVKKGTKVEAVARQEDWYQIVTAAGAKAWIHRSLVR